MEDPRDTRTPKTPPPGVRDQLAKEQPESWEDAHTGLTPVRAATKTEGETPVETLVRRTGQTKNMVIDVHSNVGTLTDRVSTLETKVDSIGEAVKTHGAQNAQIIGMTANVISILRSQQTVTETTTIAETEVKKTRAMTDLELAKAAGLQAIDERKVRSDLRRRFWLRVLKVFGLVSVAAAGAVASYLARCG